MELIIAIIISYTIGSFNLGLILKSCKLYELTSLINLDYSYLLKGKNIIGYGLILLAELLSGILLMKIAWRFGFNPLELGLMMLAMFLGHNLTPYNKKSKKLTNGEMILVGCYAAVGWSIVWIFIMCWLISFLVTGYRTLAMTIAILCLPFFVWYIDSQFTLTASIASGLLVIFVSQDIRNIISDVKKPDIHGLLQMATNYDDDII